MAEIARTPKPPYYAVIFTSHRSAGDNGYGEMATRMVELAAQQPGFLGVESARESVGITVSYWADLESIKAWKEDAEHLIAQERGREVWYSEYKTRIAKVEREYGWDLDSPASPASRALREDEDHPTATRLSSAHITPPARPVI